MCIEVNSYSCVCVGLGNTCEEAQQVAIPSVTTGNTANEAAVVLSPDCLFDGSAKKGLWYRIQPQPNRELIIQTCGSCFDTAISIYSASCSSLECIISNDDVSEDCAADTCEDFSSLASRVSFCTSSSPTEYLILLNGFNGSSGDFILTINQNTGSCTAPANQECSTAVEISSQTPPTTFSTDFASGGTMECGGVEEIDQHSIWYRVRGTGGSFSVSTCNPATTFSTALAVFEGYVKTRLFYTS